MSNITKKNFCLNIVPDGAKLDLKILPWHVYLKEFLFEIFYGNCLIFATIFLKSCFPFL